MPLIKINPPQSVNANDTKGLAIKIIGNNIRFLMYETGLQQYELAEWAGLPSSQISDLIRGKRPNISWYVLFKVSTIFGISIDAILRGQFSISEIMTHLNQDIPFRIGASLGMPRTFFSKIENDNLEKIAKALDEIDEFHRNHPELNAPNMVITNHDREIHNDDLAKLDIYQNFWRLLTTSRGSKLYEGKSL